MFWENILRKSSKSIGDVIVFLEELARALLDLVDPVIQHLDDHGIIESPKESPSSL